MLKALNFENVLKALNFGNYCIVSSLKGSLKGSLKYLLYCLVNNVALWDSAAAKKK